MRSTISFGCYCAIAIGIVQTGAPSNAADDKPAQQIVLGEGKIKLNVPQGWQSMKPRTNIVDYEFSIPAIEGDDEDGRVTVMGAGGSVDANIGRWMDQFVQPDRVETKQRTVREQKEVAGQQVHRVDVTGDYKDQPRGPFGPTVMREKFRMMGAIIVTDKLGQYFIKAVGPRRTMAANEEAFGKLINSLKVSEK